VRGTDYGLLILFLGHKPMCKFGSAGPGPVGRTCTRAPSQTDRWTDVVNLYIRLKDEGSFPLIRMDSGYGQ
jgi:hypothetical protein